MEYRRLGHSGLQVSVIGLGTNNFGPRIDYPAAERVLRQAVEVGINFIETSNTYGDGQAEAFIGKALRGHRDQVLLATIAAEQCRLLRAPGVEGFHFYTLNRAKLTLTICHILVIRAPLPAGP